MAVEVHKNVNKSSSSSFGGRKGGGKVRRSEVRLLILLASSIDCTDSYSRRRMKSNDMDWRKP